MAEPWSDIGVVETYTGGQFDLFEPGHATHEKIRGQFRSRTETLLAQL